MQWKFSSPIMDGCIYINNAPYLTFYKGFWTGFILGFECVLNFEFVKRVANLFEGGISRPN